MPSRYHINICYYLYLLQLRVLSDFCCVPLLICRNSDKLSGGNQQCNNKQIVTSDVSFQISIPAILYVIQNNLQYVAISNLEAAVFQVWREEDTKNEEKMKTS